MQIGVKVAGLDQTVKWLQAQRTNQLPFAMSVAVNQTAKDFQAAQRKSMEAQFTERRKSWVDRSVKITHFSKKGDLVIYAEIVIEAPGDPTRSDILSKFEGGGEKRARDGGEIAVPQAARRTKADIVAKSARPKAFEFKVWGSGKVATVYRGQKRTFMIVRHDGKGGIFQRVGRGKGSTLRTLFTFAKSVSIGPRLRFYETAQKTGRDRFVANAEAALSKALATAR